MTMLNNSWRRGLAITSVCLAGVVAGAAWAPAQVKTTAQPTSVAIIDLGRVSTGLDEGALIQQKLKDQETAYNNRLKELQTRLKDLTTDLEMLKDKREHPDFLTKLAEKVEVEATLRARHEALKQLMEFTEGETTRTMYLKIVAAASKIGKEAGYDLVLVDDRSIEPPANKTGAQVLSAVRERSILYASDRVDITQQVINQMNAEFKVSKK